MKLSTFGGTLLVAGTSIGAGMLGLPVLTGQAGFVPSLVVLFLCWAFMAATGLMFAELSLWFKEEVNILTMAKKTLGKWGKMFAWGLYLFLFYSLSVAYLVGGGNLLGDITLFSPEVTVLFFAALFIFFIALGKRIVDPINKLCIGGLFIAYFTFLILGTSSLNSSLLTHVKWSAIFPAFPIAFTSFGYQGMIPTLASWMHYDAKKIRLSILLGTLVTLVVYIAWMWLILGIVPVDGPHGLLDTIKEGRDAVYPLHFFTQNPAVYMIARAFAFFAIITSFLGVGIGLVDFWTDGLQLKKKEGIGKVIALILSFCPPLVFALFSQHIFLKALGLAGGFGSALLLGLLPVLMVMRAQLKKGIPLFKNAFTYLGRKWVQILFLAFIVFEMICEICSLSLF